MCECLEKVLRCIKMLVKLCECVNGFCGKKAL